MTEALKQELITKTHELMAAPSCCAEAKAAAQHWLDSLGTPAEAEATQAYVAELEADIMPVDGLVAFMGSETAAQLFGAENAAGMLAHAKELKANGSAYCDCPSCAACAAILAHKTEL